MNSQTLLRVAGTAGKVSKILGVISKILCILSFISLAGGIILFCKQLAGK